MSMIKTFDITVDLENQTNNPVFSVSQNDLNTIKVNFTLTQDAAPFDLTGGLVRMAIKKPSGMLVFQDCTIVSAVAGTASVTMSTQGFTEAGSHTAEIYVYKTEGTPAVNEVAVTGTFTYTSRAAILSDSALQSNNEFQILYQSWDKKPLIISAAPTSSPEYVGQQAYDIVSGKLYAAKALTSADWAVVSGSGGATTVVEDILTSTSAVNALSANQGNVLKGLVDGKAPTAHTHAIADVTSLQTTLDSKAPTAHSHAIADVTSLQTTLDGKVATTGGTINSGAQAVPLTVKNNNGGYTMVSVAGNNAFQSIDAAGTGNKDFNIEGYNGTALNTLTLKATTVNATGSIQEGGTALSSKYVSQKQTGGTGTVAGLWTGTQAQYNAIATKDASTLYVII